MIAVDLLSPLSGILTWYLWGYPNYTLRFSFIDIGML